METTKSPRAIRFALSWIALFLTVAPAWTGCNLRRGRTGPPGTTGTTDTNRELGRTENAPGVVIEILAVGGGSGPGGTLQAGDTLHVDFTLKKADGSAWGLHEMDESGVMVSGPTFNYQRVLEERDDVIDAATTNLDGSHRYRFPVPIPATYLPPLNDSDSFDAGDLELSGQPLLAGTYSVGLWFAWKYTVEDEEFEDVGNVVHDFLFGGETVLAAREVVRQENCAQCHTTLLQHGGRNRDVRMCVLCHTAGAEDANDPGLLGGTPGVSTDFKVMIHRIHNGEHLPSVQGVTTLADGTRDYGATPVDYVLASADGTTSVFSHVAFPVWPNLNIPMPRDEGYTALATWGPDLIDKRPVEDEIRRGVTACAKCHGDPDAAGALAAPAQGDLHRTQPSRLACGSCHDDVVWEHKYTANGQTMPADRDDSTCKQCHAPDSGDLNVADSHRHPLYDPVFNPGLNFVGLALAEAGVAGVDHDDDGSIDEGERIALTFDMVDDAGAAVAPTAFSSINVRVSGPTSNSNLLLATSIPSAMMTGSPPYTVVLPDKFTLEYLDDAADDLVIEAFQADRWPHVSKTGASTTVWERTAYLDGDAALAADAPACQNWIDVDDPAGFARGSAIVIDDGAGPGLEEYLIVQWVDGSRLWFSSIQTTSFNPGTGTVDLVPGLVHAHDAPATVKEVTLAKQVLGADYAYDPASGIVTEFAADSFLAGNAVVVTYYADFVMPAKYPLSLNDCSPQLDSSWGDWGALPIAPGTYTLGLYTAITRTLSQFGETNTYNGTSPPATIDFRVGDAAGLEPYDLITSAGNCYSCHDDVFFHGGGRRGFETCLVCHGAAGTEDRSRYVAQNAPATDDVTINFRTMLHKIHMGEELANASTYQVVGFSSAPWPGNFSAITYENVLFPARPERAKNCRKCHGDSSVAWMEPEDRDHPEGQPLPTREWRAVCGACHDSEAAVAHIDAQTSPSGHESCAICHGPGEELSVELVHKVR